MRCINLLFIDVLPICRNNFTIFFMNPDISIYYSNTFIVLSVSLMSEPQFIFVCESIYISEIKRVGQLQRCFQIY